MKKTTKAPAALTATQTKAATAIVKGYIGGTSAIFESIQKINQTLKAMNDIEKASLFMACVRLQFRKYSEDEQTAKKNWGNVRKQVSNFLQSSATGFSKPEDNLSVQSRTKDKKESASITKQSTKNTKRAPNAKTTTLTGVEAVAQAATVIAKHAGKTLEDKAFALMVVLAKLELSPEQAIEQISLSAIPVVQKARKAA